MQPTNDSELNEANNEIKFFETPNIEKGYLENGIHYFYIEDNLALTFNYHYHTFHKCLIIISGDIDYTIEGREFHLGAHDILWVPQYAAHKLEVKSTKVYRRLVIYIAPQLLDLLSLELHTIINQIGKRYPNQIQMGDEPYKELISITEKIIKIKQQEKVTQELTEKLKTQLQLSSLFLKWLESYVCRLMDEPMHNIQSGVEYSLDIQKVIEYIDKHLCEQIVSIDHIALEIHLSKFHLMRKFKQATGLTIYQYITNERLIKSRELMKAGLALNEISFLVGFADYTTFARAFKKLYSYSPKRFSGLHATYLME